jgi:hypothetical protein
MSISPRNIVWSFFVLGCFLLGGCAKEQVPVFLIPSTYRFNTPSLESKKVYVIDPISNQFKVANDTLGTFNRGNREIADSLNAIIQSEFVKTMLVRIVFETADQARLVFGRLDTVGVLDKVILSDSTVSKYSLTGNQIAFTAFPQYYVNINNDFLELNLCKEFTLRSQVATPGPSTKRYYYQDCNADLPEDVIRRIIKSAAPVKYDTISLEYVNFIFSRY